jgi:hypothetical protein
LRPAPSWNGRCEAYVRKKQKRVLMIVVGVAALALCGVQLGPILLGGRLDDPPPKKPKHKPGQARVAGRKNGGKARRPVARNRSPRGAPARGRAPARVRPRRPSDTGSELELESIAINLSATGRRRLVYSAASLRDPFAAPKFEGAQTGTALTRTNFKLQGIVRARRAGPDGSPVHLAIIDGRVYAEGEEVAKGVRIAAVDATSVVLVQGKVRVRLSMTRSVVRGL